MAIFCHCEVCCESVRPPFSIFICWLLFFCCLEAEALDLSSLDTDSSEQSTEEFLVTFSPEIILESGEACLGVRVNDSYIATSPTCSEEIRNWSASDTLQITDLYDLPLAERVKAVDNSSVKNTEMLVPVQFYDKNSHHQHAAIRTTHPEVQSVYSYSYDNYGLLQKTPVNLIARTTADKHLSYFLFSERIPLPGTPVFDSNHNIVCIVSTENQCETLSAPRRSKRWADHVKRDTENEGSSSGNTLTYIIAGAAAGGVVILTNLACCGGLHIRAYMKGMPMKVLWSALASCSYCVDPHTNYCFVAGWWGVACSWVSAYKPPVSLSSVLPIVNRPVAGQGYHPVRQSTQPTVIFENMH